MNERYSRQVRFSPIGAAGQERIERSRVAIVGMGALGTVLANHMVRAGCGFVRLIDRDFVEMSNLQRQMLFKESDALRSMPKAIAAANHLHEVNPDPVLEPHVIDMNPLSAESLLSDVDLILDGTDNFAVRFLVNDVSVKHRIPWIYGGAVSSRGVMLTVIPEVTPCLRCLFRQPPEAGAAETCETAGVISPIVDVVASYQSAEALKLLVGDRNQLNPKMVHWDLWSNQFSSMDLSKARKTDCPACAHRQFDYLDDYADGGMLQTLCGRNSIQIQPLRAASFDLKQWAERLATAGRIESNAFLLKLHLSDEQRIVLFPDGRTIIQGTDDPVQAKSLYTRYIGM